MLEKSNYVKPYPQAELNGELGLTAKEIAKSLNVKPFHIRQKLKRINIKNDEIFKASQMRCLNHKTK